MKKKVALIVTLLFFTIARAQSKNDIKQMRQGNLPQEKIYVHYNSNFLLTGETLYYKIYCLNSKTQSFSTFSKIGYIELINSNNKSVVKQKVSLKNGSGYGDFFLNTSIETGAYKLISYTNWMKNKQDFYEEDIFIVNPFSEKLKKEKKTSILTNTSTKEKNSIDLSRDTIIGNYSKREKIAIPFSDLIKENIEQLSISVRRKETINLPQKVRPINSLNNSNRNLNSQSFYLPELRGSLIKLQIHSTDSLKDMSNIKFGLSINNKITKTAITNKLGEFYFNIKNLDTSKITIQMLDNNINDYDIKISNINSIEKKFSDFPEIYLTNNILQTIKERNLFLQIENAFYSVKKDSIIKTKKTDSLFKNSKTIYILDDYKRFKTIKETFTEITKNAWLTREGDHHKIHVKVQTPLNYLTNLSSLLIVDGHIITDHNSFLNFDSRNINTISIIANNYFYGVKLYQGVVIIKTLKENYSPSYNNVKDFNVLPVQKAKKYFFQKYSNTKNKRIPDFRTQLYWNPNLSSNIKEITFYSSDVTGKFEIEVEGFTKKGKPISLRKYFLVN